MTDYRIVCTTQEPAGWPHDHAHIREVGTGDDSNQSTRQWSLDQVLDAMRRGDRFYTRGAISGQVAWVEPYTCRHCRRIYIWSKADAVQDNNLDNLRQCAWR